MLINQGLTCHWDDSWHCNRLHLCHIFSRHACMQRTGGTLSCCKGLGAGMHLWSGQLQQLAGHTVQPLKRWSSGCIDG